uniref:Putative zn2+ transporter msc2 cation diffusion facilitator superfamily n=1 Tax=Nyssomyia neivai TaxID=330878 RepID=A0A1L8DEE3_9DIPT
MKENFVVSVHGYGSTDSSTSRPAVVYCIHGQPPTQCCGENDDAFSITPSTEMLMSTPSGHCHTPRHEGVDSVARRRLIIASLLCVIFMIVEVVGGVMANSLAIATDAAHLLTDFASFMISLFAIWISGRKSTVRLSFGWYRAEVIGALVSVILIWVVTAILVFMAVERIVQKDFEVNATVMLITSGFAIFVNILMGCSLHEHGHSHSGSSKYQENINVRAAFIHVIGDVLQSVGVFIAAILIYFKPEWYLADPICTFIFSIIVVFTTVRILKDTLHVLMEGTPSYLDYTEVKATFLEIEGVMKVHNLRIWALSINKNALAAHLAIRPNANPDSVLRIATTTVHSKYNFFETTIQIEEFTPEMENCRQCDDPAV